MRRLLVIFLLVWLPLQSIWAAAAPYCQHEAAESSHLGHHTHEHRHASAEDVGGDTSRDGSGMDHADCHVCHAASPAALSLDASFQRPVSAEGVLDASLTHLTAPPSSRPERPQWRRLA